MDSLERLEGKLDRLVDAVTSIDKTLAEQGIKLSLLETAFSEVKQDLKPLQDKVQQAKGMSILIGFLVTVVETVRHLVKG